MKTIKKIAVAVAMVLASGIAFAKGIYLSIDYPNENTITYSYATFESIDTTEGVVFGEWVGYDLKNPKDADDFILENFGEIENYDEILMIQNSDYYRGFVRGYDDIPMGTHIAIYTTITNGELDMDSDMFLIPAEVNVNIPGGCEKAIEYYHFVHDTNIESYKNTAMDMIQISNGSNR